MARTHLPLADRQAARKREALSRLADRRNTRMVGLDNHRSPAKRAHKRSKARGTRAAKDNALWGRTSPYYSTTVTIDARWSA